MNKEVEYLKKEDKESFKNFITNVFDYDLQISVLEKLIANNKVLIIKNQNKIIASVIIEECFEYIKNQKYYRLSYFGVLKEYRRMGYANKIFEKINELVKQNNINYIELTSGNHRKAAYYFYKSKDFKIKDTTVFVKLY